MTKGLLADHKTVIVLPRKSVGDCTENIRMHEPQICLPGGWKKEKPLNVH